MQSGGYCCAAVIPGRSLRGSGIESPTVPSAPPSVTLAATSNNVVAYWTDIGAATVNASSTTSTTPEEARPVLQTDLATMHAAIYDAVNAIDGRHKPLIVTPKSPAAGASMEAAASAAAYGVLRALFPESQRAISNRVRQSYCNHPGGRRKR
ncbi:hypothetical protein ACHMW6_23490 [Pseudoduganella sp. UC29_106]|uniref:hypothetical protein n=1 Tax=Pseudoduganella sp. UC29_106 TaxID=3374553 RepID=UPI0037577954